MARGHDAHYFPGVRFDLSRALVTRKQAFQAWFMPLAESVIDSNG